jgi:TP901 family phage tail tape measure protein
MAEDFKVLLQVAYNLKQAQSETNKQIKELQKNAKITLDIELSDKEAKTALQQVKKDQEVLQRQKDTFNKKNLSAIDLEIKKKEEQAKIYSNQIKNQILEAQKLAKALQSAQSLSIEKDTIKNRITSYVSNNPALKEMSSDFINLRDSIDGLNKSDLNDAKKQFGLLQSEASALGKTGDTVFSRLSKNAKQFLNFLGSATIIMSGVNAIKNMVNEVYSLDTALVDLQMATGSTRSQAKELLSTYIELGQQMGATATEVSAAASDYLRQGKSIAETNELIKDSLVLSKIGNIESAEATTYLTTAMKGYQVAVSDVIGIVDKLSAVDLVSATDAGGLAEGMSEVANNARLAGVEMDKLLGYLAVIGETTGESMSSVGVGLNAIFSRMGNIKLARLKDYQNSGEDLSNVETVLSGLGVKLRDSYDTFRNFGDVLDEVASKWTSYSDVSQRALASAFAGTNHMEEFLVLMENYGTAMDYSTVAAGSAGTAMEKFQNYEESLEAKTKRLSASFQKLANDTLDSGLVKGFLDIANSLVNLTNEVGIFNIALLATAGILGSKGIVMIPKLATFVGGLIQPMLGASAAAGTLAGTLGAAFSVVLPVAAVIGAIALYKELNVTLEENQAKLAKQKEVYDTETSNIKNLEQELQNAKSKLEELNKIGGAVVTKDGEQEKLQAQTEELQRQLDIAKETQRIAGLEAEKTATETLGSNINSRYNVQEIHSDFSGYSVKYEKVTRDVELERVLSNYKELSDTYTELEKKQQDLANANAGTSKEFKTNQKELTSLSSKIDDTRKYANELASEMQNESESLIGATDSGNQMKAMVEGSLSSYSSWLDSINSTNDTLSNTESVSDSTTSAIESSTDAVEDATKMIDSYQSAMSTIKKSLSDVGSLSTSDLIDLMQEFSTFDWNKYGVTGVSGVGDLSGALKALALEQYNFVTANAGTNDSLKALYSETVKLSGATDSYTNSLGTVISSISTFNSSLSSLDSAYASLISKQAVSISDLASLSETFGDTAGFEDFIKTISSANAVTSDVQEAFNSLAGTYLSTSGVLNNLNDSNKGLIVTQLQHIGISNAEEVVTRALAQQKVILAETGLDVKSATADEIIELIKEGNVSDETKISLANLAAQKLNVNNVALSTSGDIQNLISLMSITNSTTEALQALQMAKEGKIPMSVARPGDMESMLKRAQSEVDAYYKGLGNYQNVTYTGGEKTSDKKSGGNKEKEKSKFSQQVDWIEKSMKNAEKSVSEFENTMSNTGSYKKQADELESLIAKQKELQGTYSKSSKAYKSYYEDALKGVPKDLRSKYKKMIESGETFTIEDFSGLADGVREKTYNAVMKASGYWDNYSDVLENNNNLLKEIGTNTKKAFELRVDENQSPFAKKTDRQQGILSDVDQALNFVDEGSIEQLQLLETGYFTASKSVDNLKKQIIALNKEYKNNKSDENYKNRLFDLEKQLGDSASAMKSYQDEIVSAMKAKYDKQKDDLEDVYDEQLKLAEEAHKLNIKMLDEELDAYKKIIDAQKESLDAEKEKYEYEKSIAKKTKDISNIQARMAELQKAANSGDRSAQSEISKLQEELSEKQEDLTDTQYDHRIDLEKDALDKAYDDYEDLINKRIDGENSEYENYKKNAKDLYDLKLGQITSLYESEKGFIIEAANLTASEFSKAFDSINSVLAEYGLSMSSDLASTLKATNNVSKKTSAVSSVIGSGGEVTKVYSATSGASDLNKYLASKGYNTLDVNQMFDLAKALGISGISSTSDLTVENKNKILASLKAAGFEKGGVASLTNPNALVRNLTGGKEDGLAFVRNGEAFIAPEDTGIMKELLSNLSPLNNLVKLANPNYENLVTSSTPGITIGNMIEITGNADANIIPKITSAGNDILSKLADLIRQK